MPKKFGKIATMSPDPARFGQIVKGRREQLGLRQDQLAALGGPSTTTMSKIENAADEEIPAKVTFRKLDASLQWEPGSAARTLAGGEPTPLTRENKELRYATMDELLAEIRRRVDDSKEPPMLEFVKPEVPPAADDSGMRRA